MDGPGDAGGIRAAHRRHGVRASLGGVRQLSARMLRRPPGLAWFAVAFVAFPLVWGLAAVVARGLGADVAWAYPPETSQHVIAMVLVPLVEETGWRGFALPRLLAHGGPLRATAILGVIWAAWHACIFVVTYPSAPLLAASFVNILVGAVVFTWVFLRTRGSLLAAVLAHIGAHLNNPGHVTGDATPMVVYTAAIAVVAAALIVFDRRAWSAASVAAAIG